jgi:hypothetical protein
VSAAAAESADPGYEKDDSSCWFEFVCCSVSWFGFGSGPVNYCSDLWWMPSPAPVASVVLNPASGAVVLSSVASITRAGENNITLGRLIGFTQDLNFSVRAEDGTTGSNFTIRILQVCSKKIDEPMKQHERLQVPRLSSFADPTLCVWFFSL